MLKELQLKFVKKPVLYLIKSQFKHLGEALYCDDIPRVENELYVTFVLSTRPYAKILNIDTSQALAMPGVHAFFCANDLDEGSNEMGPIFHDEKVFYTDEVGVNAVKFREKNFKNKFNCLFN